MRTQTTTPERPDRGGRAAALEIIGVVAVALIAALVISRIHGAYGTMWPLAWPLGIVLLYVSLSWGRAGRWLDSRMRGRWRREQTHHGAARRAQEARRMLST